MKEEYKKLLKTVGCWFLVSLIVVFIMLLLNGFDKHDLVEVSMVAISLIATPILFCIVFAPALIALWFIYKKTNNIKWRIFWFSVLIPFNNLIYYYIEKYISSSLYMPFTSMLIGASVLFFILPFVGIFSLFTPKKFLPQRNIILMTAATTFFAGFAMMYIGISVPIHVATKFFPNTYFTYNDKEHIEALKEYDPVIKYIEDNKACPDKKRLKELDVECTSRNNGNDIILRKYFEHSIGDYYYCTDKTAKECKIGYDEYSNVTKKMGKWFINYYDD